MNYENLEQDNFEQKISENINVTMYTNPDDDDEYATQEELAELEDIMFPDGVDDDNYPDLSGSD